MLFSGDLRKDALLAMLGDLLDEVMLGVLGATDAEAWELRLTAQSFRRVIQYWNFVSPTPAQQTVFRGRVFRLADKALARNERAKSDRLLSTTPPPDTSVWAE